nr:TIGR02450 family Trp-rich protein [uncultured Duganella sp.]
MARVQVTEMVEINNMPVRRLSPQKLRLSKWTAMKPANKEKHFMVVELVEPESPGGPVVSVVLEAVHSRRRQTMPWRELEDLGRWAQGWH